VCRTKTVSARTSLEHCVPFPAPGPPRTNTTAGGSAGSKPCASPLEGASPGACAKQRRRGRRNRRVQSAAVCPALQRADDVIRECVLPSRRTSAVVAVISGEAADQQGDRRPWSEGGPPKVSSEHGARGAAANMRTCVASLPRRRRRCVAGAGSWTVQERRTRCRGQF
jgi:hypothetical protein